MALSDTDKANLDKIRQDYIKRTSPDSAKLEKVINEVDLSNINYLDLKSLCRPDFVVGVNFKAINTAAPFTTTDMNRIAPGAIDVGELKAKLSNQSMLQGRSVEIIDTQSGVIVITSSLFINADIEDIVSSKTESQGTNLQFMNRAKAINAESVDEKEIKSRFLE